MNSEKTKMIVEVTLEEFESIFEREANNERYRKVRESSRVQQYYQDMLKNVQKTFSEHAKDVEEIIGDEKLVKGYEELIKKVIVESALKQLLINGEGKTFDEVIVVEITEENVKKGIDLAELFITETFMEIFNDPQIVVHVGFVN